MKALEFWAKQKQKEYAKEEERVRQVVYTAYIDGFRAGREKAASFLETFQSELSRVCPLIRAIGQAECDPETGKFIDQD